MRAIEFLAEARAGLLQYLKQLYPTWPDYVVKDFLYQQAKTITDDAQLQEWLSITKRDFGNVTWKLQNIPITMNVFNPDTQRRMKERNMGSSNPYQVPRDAERHAQQLQMLQQKGISKEPIIVLQTPNGYDLIEGWHRTIQHLQLYPKGYTAPAYVGISAK